MTRETGRGPTSQESRSFEHYVRQEETGLDYHDPTAGIGGAPPARSALGLRLGLAIFGVGVCTAIAVFSAMAGYRILAGVLAFLAAIALIDIVVVGGRMRRERRRARRPRRGTGRA